MRLIGLVGSGSTTAYAPIIIWDKAEQDAREEQLIVIDDRRRNARYLGVLRNVKRYEPFLNMYRRTSYVDNPDLVDTGTFPHTGGYVALIGVVSNGELVEAQLPPDPGSRVYVVENPSDIGVSFPEGLIVGRHKYSGLEIPLDPRGLPYHIGVVGATGTGKSRLVKALVDEVLDKTGFRVIVFDHTGMDYVKYYPDRVVEASRVILDPSLIIDLMLKRTGLYPNTYEPYLLYSLLKCIYNYYYRTDSSVLEKISSKQEEEGEGSQTTLLSYSGSGFKRDDFRSFVENLDFEKLMEVMAEKPVEWSRQEFRRAAVEAVGEMRGKESSKIRVGVAIDVRLGESFFKSLSGRNVLPRDIVDKAFTEKLVVVDLSTEELETRRYIVAGVIGELWRRIESERKSVNTIIVVDEAHNYACRGCGESHYAITRVAREGRKWGLGLVLATQRIMDIDPDIRSNVNTWFFSKLQTPNDYNELKGYMDLAGITEQSLAVLGKREFYLAGLMNPLRVPVLIKVREVE